MNKFFLLLLVVVLSGCAAVPKIKMVNAYNHSEVAWYKDKGKGVVAGSAFLKRRNGNLVTCAGNEVSIFPVGKYSTERILHIYGNAKQGYSRRNNLELPDERYLKDAIAVLCDVDGKFQFKELAKGEWYIVTHVMWRVGNYSVEGGYLMKRISIIDDEPIKIVMTH